MTALLVILHVLGATVWTGGHLVLALAVLPRVLRERAPAELLRFEAGFEKIGIPALLLQVASGLLLAARMLPPAQWLELHNPVARLVCTSDSAIWRDRRPLRTNASTSSGSALSASSAASSSLSPNSGVSASGYISMCN